MRRVNGLAGVEPGQVVEIDRSVDKDGLVGIGGIDHLVGFAWAGGRVTLRLDGHLLHAIADYALIGTWPCRSAASGSAGCSVLRDVADKLR